MISFFFRRLNDGALAAMNCRAVVVDEDVSPTTTCCVHRDIWARGSSRGQPLRGDVAGSLSTAKKPTKGILKKSRSVDSRECRDVVVMSKSACVMSYYIFACPQLRPVYVQSRVYDTE